MRKTNYHITGLLLVVIILITSCKESAPKQAKYIPKDASVVLSMNPKNLQDKLADSKISLDSIMRSAFSNDTSLMITADDIANSGIDLSKDVYAFVNQSGSMMSGTSVTTGIVAIMDKVSSFESFLKKKMAGAQIKKEGDYSFVTLQNGFVAGWNDDVLLIDNVSSYNTSTGEQTGGDNAAQAQLTTLFTQKEDASLASVGQFRNVANDKADMLFWSNSNSALSSVPMIGMSKASDLFKDTYTSGSINFQNGKVEMDLKTFPNKVLADTLKKYAGPKVDMSLLNKYPGAVNGFAVFSFDPKLIVAILDFIGVTQTANQFLQNQGFTLEDITTAFKGDFAIIFSNFGITEKENPYNPGQPAPAPSAKLIIDAAIGNKATYDKIVSQLASKGLMVQQNGQYVPSFLADDPTGFIMSTDAKNIIFSSDAALLQQYKGGTGKVVLPPDIADKANGSSTAFYVDIASILNTIPKDTASAAMIDAAKQTFKDVIATSENFSNNVIKGHAELRTMNDKENSLATLTRYFGSLAATIKNLKSTTGTDDINFNNMPSDSSMTDDMDSTDNP